ncbi:methyltransferase type 11 [Streptomyces sp. NPDC048142]|uniref:methyltransferase type 11 n=1 Tax=Streptomyces sp. NPDC048142 TaxID=3365501 RepID=UPI00371B93FD
MSYGGSSTYGNESGPRTHRALLAGHRIDYFGVDVRDGPNVDAVMTNPYRIPARSNSADVVLSGQGFEHIPFFRALAAHSRLELREACTDFPPQKGIWRDYRAIDGKAACWGDSVGVFRKPQRYPRLTMFAVREPAVWWANRVGGVDGIPLPRPVDGRERCGRPEPAVVPERTPTPTPEQVPAPERTPTPEQAPARAESAG